MSTRSGAFRPVSTLRTLSGGVNGHPLQLQIIDDQSTISGNATAAEQLVGNGAFGVIEDSSFTFGAYKYLAQQGVPVTGAAIDGPEWATPGFENMFSVSVPIDGPIDGNFYTYDNLAQLYKQLGVTKLAGVAYAIESAIQSVSSLIQAAEPLGISCATSTTRFPSVTPTSRRLCSASRPKVATGSMGHRFSPPTSL